MGLEDEVAGDDVDGVAGVVAECGVDSVAPATQHRKAEQRPSHDVGRAYDCGQGFAEGGLDDIPRGRDRKSTDQDVRVTRDDLAKTGRKAGVLAQKQTRGPGLQILQGLRRMNAGCHGVPLAIRGEGLCPSAIVFRVGIHACVFCALAGVIRCQMLAQGADCVGTDRHGNLDGQRCPGPGDGRDVTVERKIEVTGSSRAADEHLARSGLDLVERRDRAA